MSEWTNPPLSRRACLSMLAVAAATWSATARAQASKSSFDQWVAAFRARARARGISDATYTRVMGNIKPDTTVFELIRSQPEFNEQLWQYLNRRVSDWRITTGKEKAKEYAPLFARIEKDYGVDRGIMLGLWGIESAFGDPDVQKNHMRPVIHALAGTAQYLVKRGKYRPGEHWGYEVRGAGGMSGKAAPRTYESWQKAGVTRADGKAFPQPNASAKLWVPVPGGPAFLLGPNFYAVRSYNPSMNYTLSIVHLGDRVMGGGPLVQAFPGGERTPTLAEVQEIQQRLTALGFDTGGTDGRVGNDTMLAVRNFQRKVGMQPADGYAGVKLLARLRQGL